ncbi:hypothetical protein CEUSTIGMA_g13025.t1 [Chlamydomonas eustigma]|uniref:J domain-containing protein n=1 Tax=Chlamydomonas eustigma TaxID=1157962 RepID=A0A250XS36_9CHLO|nr:hypothetical protein CEUSTIGMA_g13025.t1 [Chlamydomonas eustigma]|eukprot:GAX85610.1 hypothetical protein CEUSTIGMA_g13025.t1 [Chlamydomonas eustigma]
MSNIVHAFLICSASDEDLRKSYRKAALKYHPDKAATACRYALELPVVAEAAGSRGASSGGSGTRSGSTGGGAAAAETGGRKQAGVARLSSHQSSTSAVMASLRLVGSEAVAARIREAPAELFNYITQEMAQQEATYMPPLVRGGLGLPLLTTTASSRVTTAMPLPHIPATSTNSRVGLTDMQAPTTTATHTTSLLLVAILQEQLLLKGELQVEYLLTKTVTNRAFIRVAISPSAPQVATSNIVGRRGGGEELRRLLLLWIP